MDPKSPGSLINRMYLKEYNREATGEQLLKCLRAPCNDLSDEEFYLRYLFIQVMQ